VDPPPKAERDRGKKESREQQALLKSKWPLAFPANKQDIRPLAIGVSDEIATTMGWSAPYTFGVIGGWKSTAAYCRAVLAHDRRIALDGSPAEPVEPRARALAARQLANFTTREAKRTANAAQPPKPVPQSKPAPSKEALRARVRAALLRRDA